MKENGQLMEKQWKTELKSQPLYGYEVNMSPLIAIVEDDPDQSRNYSDALTKRGFCVTIYSSRIEALEGFNQHPPDLAIVDVVLGDEFSGGFDLFKDISNLTPDLPVIFLTSRVDEIDQVFGLRLGAWDYQTKPVSLTLLAERVTALLNIKTARSNGLRKQQAVDMQCGELTIDLQGVQVRWKDQPLTFTVTECAMLAAIVKANGAAVRYDELAKVTKQSIVTNNTLNTHIRHIRAKFKQIDGQFDCIANVYGAGYRWSCN